MISIPLSKQLTISADDLLQQHLLILGATGSGKSTSAMTILHGLMSANQTTMIIDPTGEYQHLPNAVIAKLGYNAYIDYEQLTGDDFNLLFGVTDVDMQEKLVDALTSLKIQKNIIGQPGIYKKINRPWQDFEEDIKRLYHYPQPVDISLLPEQLRQEYAIPVDDFDLIGQEIDEIGFKKCLPLIRRIKRLINQPRFQHLFHMPITDETSAAVTEMQTDVMYLLRLFASHKSDHKILVIDCSIFTDNLELGKVLVSLLTTALLREKQQLKHSVLVTVLIDEAHRYLMADHLETTGIFRIAREGRKLGLFLMVTTQSPLDLAPQLLGQFGHYLVHQLNTASELAQLPVLQEYAQQIVHENIGQALLAGNNFVTPQLLNIQMVAEMNHQTATPKFF
ncbi:MAG: ATP-binding protein [Weissella hellenica]|uniref:ATP-binding protein n=1 Tax=Weissella hellenica TaxID=46256 RepID=UPI003F9B8EAE